MLLVSQDNTASYTVTITNAKGKQSLVVLQGYARRTRPSDGVAAERPAGGTNVSCDNVSGELPHGTCSSGFSINVRDGAGNPGCQRDAGRAVTGGPHPRGRSSFWPARSTAGPAPPLDAAALRPIFAGQPATWPQPLFVREETSPCPA